MKKLILSLLFLFPIICLAKTTIYCPKCKQPLYSCVGEIKAGSLIKAEDFIPVNENIQQPKPSDKMVCPFDGAELNGWLYWSQALGRNNKLVYNTISVLTKDENNNWKWVPYDIDLPEMKELMKDGNN